MIIRCEACGTKYRFDDTLMEAEGAWVRCTHCEAVFFQQNPNREAPRPEPEKLVEEPEAPPQEMSEASDLKILLPGSTHPSDTARQGDTVMLAADRIRETLREAEPRRMPVDYPPPAMDKPSRMEENEEEEEPLPPEMEAPRRRPSFLLIFMSVLLILLIGGTAFLFLYPDVRRAVISDLVSSVPALEAVFGKDLQSAEINPADIRIQQVRRRIMANVLLGDLLIVEGTAQNTSSNTVSRIRIQGRLYDPADQIVRSRISYGGNHLTDAELASLTEEDLQKRLSFPQITPAPKDSLAPGAAIPFMIVFALDKAGVDKTGIIKTGVIPLDAERALP
ncbi:MAG: hypothetical protein CVU61_13125 [Deltaproteobacteria bacterium HGW-Deltaproteobacteria-19]|nr:MAG: hypothetical protein CVU61_13125 [Deltaproteobacteria bacterium HGW-Deltaproteobacteria-19]